MPVKSVRRRQLLKGVEKESVRRLRVAQVAQGEILEFGTDNLRPDTK